MDCNINLDSLYPELIGYFNLYVVSIESKVPKNIINNLIWHRFWFFDIMRFLNTNLPISHDFDKAIFSLANQIQYFHHMNLMHLLLWLLNDIVIAFIIVVMYTEV